MDSSLGESPDGGSTELVTVPELEAVGLARQHSVPLVKIVTSTTQDHLNDVINSPLGDVINTSGDVTIHANDVTLSPATSIVVREGCTTSATSHMTPSTTTSTHGETKASTTFHLEPDWREAAQEPVLTIRCKTLNTCCSMDLHSPYRPTHNINTPVVPPSGHSQLLKHCGDSVEEGKGSQGKKKTVAELVKSRFGSGSRGKCIHLGKQWFTPTEFEAHCGRSASKDWKRSIRFQGQSLQTLIKEGYLQVHATSCSCGACLDDDAAAGSVRLHRPYKRKRRDRFFLDTEKALKHGVSETHGSATPTVTLPVSGLGELTVVPGIVLGSGTASSGGGLTTTAPATSSIASTASSPTPANLANLPLDKAWERMNEVLLGLERSVSGARVLLEELRERTRQETLDVRQKLIQEKDEAVAQAKLEAQLSNMAKSSEGFLVQVREDDGSQSLQPIMLDSLISNVPSLNPAPPINGVRKKCVNCNRESGFECSGCHNRAYCNDFCQRRDWVNHQSECGRSSPPPEDPLKITQAPGYIFMLSD